MLGFGRGPKSHFARDEAKLASLLSEAKRFKGESLWQDAWRRIKRNRGAFWSLVFLAIFMTLSLIAPLLPIPSPMALDLVDEPQPPRWPWAENPRLAENLEPARAKKRFGLYATESMGAFADNSWAHRSFVDLVRPLAPGEDPEAPVGDTALRQFIEQTSGREPIVYAKPGDEPGTVLERHALVYRDSDRSRVRWRDTETIVGARTSEVAQPTQGTAVWIDLLLPPAEASSGSDELATPSDHRASIDGESAVVELWESGNPIARYETRLRGETPFVLAGARLARGGEWPELNADYESMLDSPPTPALEARLAAARLQAPDGGVVTVRGKGGVRVLFDERSLPVMELRPEPGRGLAKQLEEALAESELAATIATVDHMEGTWELNWLDRQLVKARAALFGFWQTGPLLGTDGKGRDLLSRIVWGSRISIQASVLATLFSLLIGVTYGAFAGLMGGRIDNLMMRFVDVLYAVPFIFVVIFLLTILAEYDVDRMKVFYVVIGAIYWLTMARVVRGQVLSLKNQEFVESARVLGASTPRILFVHLVPNVLSIVIVYLTLTIPAIMLFEAFLSFLGLGVEAPKVSWGLLAMDGTEAISAIKVFWWVVAFPALAMGSTLLALNILGDGLRDALDPKLRGKD